MYIDEFNYKMDYVIHTGSIMNNSISIYNYTNTHNSPEKYDLIIQVNVCRNVSCVVINDYS